MQIGAASLLTYTQKGATKMIKKHEVVKFFGQVRQVPFVRRGIKIIVLFYAFAGVWFMFFQDGVIQRATEKSAEIQKLKIQLEGAASGEK